MKKCTIEICNNKYYSKGYCIKHYRRWKRHGNPHKLGYRRDVNHPNYGKHLPQEHRDKIAKSNLGQKRTQKQKLNISSASIEREKSKQQEYQDQKIECYCNWCGQPILTHPYKVFNQEYHFCSRKCLGKWNYYDHLKAFQHHKSGAENAQWRGGISFEPYPPEFNNDLKDKVKERDGFMCQLCNKEKGAIILVIHHINYIKDDCRIENLIALCYSCNSKVNTNRDYWERYFQLLTQSPPSSPN